MDNKQLFDTAAEYIHFVQTISKERREAMGIYALETECNVLVEWSEFMDFIQDFVEIPSSEEFNWQVLVSQSRMHSGIRMPLGTASAYFVATDHFENAERKLIASASNGMKALIAIFTSSSDVLEILSQDFCTFVRLAVALRISNFPNSQDEIFDKCARWLTHDPYFPVRAARKGDIELLDPDLSDTEFETLLEVNDEYAIVSDNPLLNIWDCNCAFNESLQEELWSRYFETTESNQKNYLRSPQIPQEFQIRVRGFSNFFIGTQPFPDPMADYLQQEESVFGFSRLGILSYLKQSIPDQLVISHAGHGINSYSLNFRFAKGRLAIAAQVGWGGVYMDQDSQAKSWNSMVAWLDKVTALEQVPFQGDYKNRDFLIVYSDFRNDLTVEERRGDDWFVHSEISDPEELIKFLEKNL